MQKHFRAAAVILLFFMILTGIAYPLVVTAIAQLIFPGRANGSFLIVEGRVVGSELIGQQFSDSLHFWGRPSATGLIPYDAGASAGSNLAPTNGILIDSIRARVARLHESDPESTQRIPIDIVTASGSGLDPHISLAGAACQVQRIAHSTGLSASALNALISSHAEGRSLGFLGEPRVNVLQLNVAVDRLLAQNGSR